MTAAYLQVFESAVCDCGSEEIAGGYTVHYAGLTECAFLRFVSLGPEFRVGRSLGTTIYDEGDDEQPVAWFPAAPELARGVVALLNAVTAGLTGPSEEAAR